MDAPVTATARSAIALARMRSVWRLCGPDDMPNRPGSPGNPPVGSGTVTSGARGIGRPTLWLVPGRPASKGDPMRNTTLTTTLLAISTAGLAAGLTGGILGGAA